MLGANNHKQNRYGFTVLMISQKIQANKYYKREVRRCYLNT